MRTVGGGLDLLLIVRGLAAISVVVWHVEGYKGTAPAALNVPGTIAVWLFFGISGYVIAHGFIHRRYELRWRDLGVFFWNRFLRIYPLFFALSVLAAATAWLRTGVSPLEIADIPAEFFALQFNQNYHLIGVFWTLGVEMHFYLLTPLLVLPLLARGGAGIAVAAAIYVAAVAFHQYAAWGLGWSFDGRNIVTNLPHFLAGMIACRVLAAKPVPVPAGLTVGSALVLLAIGNWTYHGAPSAFWSISGILFVDVIIVLLVLAHARLERTPVRLPRVYRVFETLGILSYGIYAWRGYFLASWPWTRDQLVALTLLSVAGAFVWTRMVGSRGSRPRHTGDLMTVAA